MMTPSFATADATSAICITVACGPAGLLCSPTGWPTPAHAVSHCVISLASGMSEAEMEKMPMLIGVIALTVLGEVVRVVSKRGREADYPGIGRGVPSQFDEPAEEEEPASEAA